MKIYALSAFLIALFSAQARAEAYLDSLRVSEFHCLTSTGIKLDARESAQQRRGDLALDVDTIWFGASKSFTGSSIFYVQPRGELNVTLSGDPAKYFFLRMTVNPEEVEEQRVSATLSQSGYAGFQSPGQHLFLATAYCRVKLKRISF